MAEKKPTFERWVLKSIMPATGWRAVYVDDDGTHRAEVLYVLALAYERRYDAHTQQKIPDAFGMPEDELYQVVGMDYDPGGSGFAVCDELANFCGLMPPDMSMMEFEAHHHGLCPHRPGIAGGKE